MNVIEEQKQALLTDVNDALLDFGTADELYPTQGVQVPTVPEATEVTAPITAPTGSSTPTGLPEQTQVQPELTGEPQSTYLPPPTITDMPSFTELPRYEPVYSGEPMEVNRDAASDMLIKLKLEHDPRGSLLGSQTPNAISKAFPLETAGSTGSVRITIPDTKQAWHHYLLNPIPGGREGYLEVFPNYYVKNVGTLGGAFDWLLTPFRAGYGLMADTQRGYYMLRRFLANTPGGIWYNDTMEKLQKIQSGEIDGQPVPGTVRLAAGALRLGIGTVFDKFAGDDGLDEAIYLFNQPNMFRDTRDEGASGRFISMFPNLTAATVGADLASFATTAQTRQGSDLTFSLGTSAEFTNPYSGTFLGWRNPFTGERIFDIEKWANNESWTPIATLPGGATITTERLGAAGGFATLFISDVLNPVNLLLDIPVDKAMRAIGRSGFWQTKVNPFLTWSRLNVPIQDIFRRQAADAVNTLINPTITWEARLRAQLADTVEPAEIDNIVERTKAGLPGGSVQNFTSPEEASDALARRLQARGYEPEQAAELAQRVQLAIKDPVEYRRLVREASLMGELQQAIDDIAASNAGIREQLQRAMRVDYIAYNPAVTPEDAATIQDGDFLVWDSELGYYRPNNSSELTVADVQLLNSKNSAFIWDAENQALRTNSLEAISEEQFTVLQEEHGYFWDSKIRGFTNKPNRYVPASTARTEAEALIAEYELMSKADEAALNATIPDGTARTRAELLIADYERRGLEPYEPLSPDSPEFKAQYEQYLEEARTLTYTEAAATRFNPTASIPDDAILVEARPTAKPPNVFSVYHGTREVEGYSGASSAGLGAWFGTDNYDYAASYGRVSRYDVKLNNPYEMSRTEFLRYDRREPFESSRQRRAELEAAGHDGIIVTHDDGVREFILFNAPPASAAPPATLPVAPLVAVTRPRPRPRIAQDLADGRPVRTDIDSTGDTILYGTSITPVQVGGDTVDLEALRARTAGLEAPDAPVYEAPELAEPGAPRKRAATTPEWFAERFTPEELQARLDKHLKVIEDTTIEIDDLEDALRQADEGATTFTTEQLFEAEEELDRLRRKRSKSITERNKIQRALEPEAPPASTASLATEAIPTPSTPAAAIPTPTNLADTAITPAELAGATEAPLVTTVPAAVPAVPATPPPVAKTLVPQSATREQLVKALRDAGLKISGNVSQLKARVQRLLDGTLTPTDKYAPAVEAPPGTKPKLTTQERHLRSRLDSVNRALSTFRKQHLREGVYVMPPDAKVTLSNLEAVQYKAQQALLTYQSEQAAKRVITAEQTLDVLAATRRAIDAGEWSSDLEGRIRSDANRLGVNSSGSLEQVTQRVRAKAIEERATVDGMTVAQLRTKLSSLGVSVRGEKKDELQALLRRVYDDMQYIPPEATVVADNPLAIAADEYNNNLMTDDAAKTASRLTDQYIHEQSKEVDAALTQYSAARMQTYQAAIDTLTDAKKAQSQVRAELDAAVQEVITKASKAQTSPASTPEVVRVPKKRKAAPPAPTPAQVAPAPVATPAATAQAAPAPAPAPAPAAPVVPTSSWGKKTARTVEKARASLAKASPAMRGHYENIIAIGEEAIAIDSLYGSSFNRKQAAVDSLLRNPDLNSKVWQDIRKSFPLKTAVETPAVPAVSVEDLQEQLVQLRKDYSEAVDTGKDAERISLLRQITELEEQISPTAGDSLLKPELPTPSKVREEVSKQFTLASIRTLEPYDQIAEASALFKTSDVPVHELRAILNMSDEDFMKTLKQLEQDDMIELIADDVLDMTPTDIAEAFALCGVPISFVRFL